MPGADELDLGAGGDVGGFCGGGGGGGTGDRRGSVYGV